MTEPSRAPEPELLPCPHCGHKPDVIVWNDSGTPGEAHYRVTCVSCLHANDQSTEAEAIAAWNRRSATPASPAGTGAIACRDEAEAHVAVAEMFSGKFGNIQGVTVSTFALTPSSPREPSEAAWIRPANHCDTEARPISQKTVTEYRCVVCGDHFVGDSGYRAIDFPPSGGTT